MLSIEGTLRLTSPLHVSAFEGSWRLNDDRRAIQGDNGGKPLTRMARLPMADKENNLCDVPFIAGNGFRGRLRRLAARRVQNTVGPVSIDVYHGLHCGAVSGRPAKDSVTISGSAKARDNVYMGLFGGSPAMYPSRYRAFNCVPVTDATIGIGTVPQRYASLAPVTRRYGEPRPARPDELLGFIDFNRIDDALRFRDPEAHLMIDDYENALADWMAKTQENREAVAASKEAVAAAKSAGKGAKGKAKTAAVEKVSKSTLDAMSAIEVLVPGVNMYFRLELADSVDYAKAGLLMLCTADMVKQNRLGGWGRNGLGTFAADLGVYEDGELLSSLMPENGRNAGLHSSLENFEAEAVDALGSIKLKDLNEFFSEE